MKVYFSASVSGKKDYLNNYVEIVKILKSLGHTVMYEDLFETTVEKVSHQSTEEKVKIHQILGKYKLECDIMLIEGSHRSFAIGQEVAHAFRIGKPVLALYTDGKVPHFILTDAADRLLVSEYTWDNLKEKIIEGFDYLDPKSYKRFTMNLPSKIVDYLDGISLNQKINRSEYIRDLIQKDMNNKQK